MTAVTAVDMLRAEPQMAKTPVDRSRLMARIKGRNTVPERLLRAELRREGLRPRANQPTPYGRPDIVLAGRICIFVDGCFWHGCPDHYVRPRTRSGIWSRKLSDNVSRDQRQTLQLQDAGWRVLRFWEHEVEEDPARCTKKVLEALARVGTPAVAWRRVLVAVPVDSGGRQEYRVLVDIHGRGLPRLQVAPRHTRKWKRRK